MANQSIREKRVSIRLNILIPIIAAIVSWGGAIVSVYFSYWLQHEDTPEIVIEHPLNLSKLPYIIRQPGQNQVFIPSVLRNASKYTARSINVSFQFVMDNNELARLRDEIKIAELGPGEKRRFWVSSDLWAIAPMKALCVANKTLIVKYWVNWQNSQGKEFGSRSTPRAYKIVCERPYGVDLINFDILPHQ